MRLCDDGMSVDDWGEPSPRVSFLALPRPHTLGHERLFGGSWPTVSFRLVAVVRLSRLLSLNVCLKRTAVGGTA